MARFVYIRHGHYDKRGVPADQRGPLPLNNDGRIAALAAAAWLEQQGIRPDRVITTRARRTQETAEVVLERLGSSLKPVVKPHGFSAATFTQKVGEWFQGDLLDGTPETVLMVGHHTQQDVLETMEDMDIPSAARCCVVVCEQDTDGSWVVLDYNKGVK